MCLGIPGEVVAFIDGCDDLAMVRVEGAERPVNIGMLREPGTRGVSVGDWVLIHVGFAMELIDRSEATASLDFVTGNADWDPSPADA
ncbi:MAG: hydrogenase expression/formation protein HypC [Pseudonocardiales bacterium]|jgi:hydrogenase assembly chaperone HypC/HupF|uniref:HypC/HybG/HupF family hydrogenase formation chaperone n=1 Tax=Pseudonocardia sp. TaxID=60912 RepID=UPI00260A0916|nr:HypC/HybG/HupF family hydrogenase formation chaperone [Pseudonocardia sp.]MCW2720214.1 hydrogenase assembly chaperone hypC/hupF [Pseudonocardia sp.]MDT7617626.1 hydrogenase expression/formation protein HypC [Pseudonocardiales bacterium]MDT7708514.1 hydrogenase expression/formation protein HypC [Pseudonocardiales bacterium]